MMKKLKRPLYTRMYEFPKQIKYDMKQMPKIDSSVLNDYSPKAVVKSPKSEDSNGDEIASVLSSQTDCLPKDNSVVDQIVEDSKKSISNPTATECPDLNNTEKI